MRTRSYTKKLLQLTEMNRSFDDQFKVTGPTCVNEPILPIHDSKDNWPTIDFDEASKAWKMNKISKRNGMYVYACEEIKRDGCKCNHPVSGRSNYCCRHNKKYIYPARYTVK